MSWQRPRRLHRLAMSYAEHANFLKQQAENYGARAIEMESRALNTYNETCGEEPTRGILEKGLGILRDEWGKD